MTIARGDEEAALVVVDQVVAVHAHVAEGRRSKAPERSQQLGRVDGIALRAHEVERAVRVEVLERVGDRLPRVDPAERRGDRVHDLVRRRRRVRALDQMHDGDLDRADAAETPFFMRHSRDRADESSLVEPPLERVSADPLERLVVREEQDALAEPFGVADTSSSGIEVVVVGRQIGATSRMRARALGAVRVLAVLVGHQVQCASTNVRPPAPRPAQTLSQKVHTRNPFFSDFSSTKNEI